MGPKWFSRSCIETGEGPTEIETILCGIVLGMRYVHSRGFIHQDLKPSSILLNEKGEVGIGYFGVGRDESVDVTLIAAGLPRSMSIPLD
jgi:serine/threonine protein kinase